MSVAQNLELGRLKRRTATACTGRGAHPVLLPAPQGALGTAADYLSGGEQQMVGGRPRAVRRHPGAAPRRAVRGLAPAVVESLFETFDALRKEVSIVIVDHNLDLALACRTAPWRWSAAG